MGKIIMFPSADTAFAADLHSVLDWHVYIISSLPDGQKMKSIIVERLKRKEQVWFGPVIVNEEICYYLH